MDIAQIYLQLGHRPTPAEEYEKIQQAIKKLQKLPMKPQPILKDIQKERYEEMLLPIYEDLDEFQIDITQMLLDYKMKNSDTNYPEIIDSLYEWKKQLNLSVAETGDVLISRLPKISEEFELIQAEIKERLKEILDNNEMAKSFERVIGKLPKIYKAKIERLENKIDFGYDKIYALSKQLVPLHIQRKYEETNRKEYNLRRVIRRMMRIDWLKKRCHECDLEMAILLQDSKLPSVKEQEKKDAQYEKLVKKAKVKGINKKNGKKKELDINQEPESWKVITDNYLNDDKNKIESHDSFGQKIIQIKRHYDNLTDDFIKKELEEEDIEDEWDKKITAILTKKDIQEKKKNKEKLQK